MVAVLLFSGVSSARAGCPQHSLTVRLSDGQVIGALQVGLHARAIPPSSPPVHSNGGKDGCPTRCRVRFFQSLQCIVPVNTAVSSNALLYATQCTHHLVIWSDWTSVSSSSASGLKLQETSRSAVVQILALGVHLIRLETIAAQNSYSS